MINGGPLALVLAALKELGGYFVWKDAAGEEYVIISRGDFERRLAVSAEEQLDLLNRTAYRETAAKSRTADDMLEKINRDLAQYQLQREEDGINLTYPLPPSTMAAASKQGKTVRFEPLRGDLSPELQE